MKVLANKPVCYFISDGIGHTKIGIASDLMKRFHTIQVGNANKLEIIHAIYREDYAEIVEIEKEIHAVLSDEKVSGEWFNTEAVEKFLNGEYERPKHLYLCDIDPNFDFTTFLEAFLDSADQYFKNKKKK